MDPISTYVEVRLEGRRHYELFSDRVRVVGTSLQADLDISVPLNLLSPRVVRFKLRRADFWTGLWLMLASFIVCSILISGFKLDPLGFGVGLTAIVGVGGGVLSATTAKKLEFARFESNVGLPLLDIAFTGKDRTAFDAFTEKIVAQIRANTGH